MTDFTGATGPYDYIFNSPIIQMPPETIVPDSVEPYIGWKALTLSPGGTLHSPSYQTAWPSRQPLEATCKQPNGNHTHFRWTTSRIPPDPKDEIGFSFDVTRLEGWDTMPPAVELPDGLYWTLEPHTAPVVHEFCMCGIYAVKDPDDTKHYLDLFHDNVLVQVALWGRVIKGDLGARGQYAYPQQIIVPQHLRDHAEALHNTYGVPVVIADLPGPNNETPPANRSKYFKPGPAQIFFLLTIAITILMTSLPLMLGSDGIPAMFTAPLFIWLTNRIINNWDKLNG